jgi:hypothetical protein
VFEVGGVQQKGSGQGLWDGVMCEGSVREVGGWG